MPGFSNCRTDCERPSFPAQTNRLANRWFGLAGGGNRGIVGHTCLRMGIAHGPDAAIIDPLDKELMGSAIAAVLPQGKMIYRDSYLDAARSGRKALLPRAARPAPERVS